MKIVDSEMVLSREEWLEAKAQGRKKFIAESLLVHILLMIILSIAVNLIVALFNKITYPRFTVVIFVFIVEPVLLAIVNSLFTMRDAYIVNSMLHEDKVKDKKRYEKYFLKEKITSALVVIILFLLNINSLTHHGIGEIITSLILGAALAGLKGFVDLRFSFNEWYEKAMKKINEEAGDKHGGQSDTN